MSAVRAELRSAASSEDFGRDLACGDGGEGFAGAGEVGSIGSGESKINCEGENGEVSAGSLMSRSWAVGVSNPGIVDAARWSRSSGVH